ncbi:Arc family DNA-binding protein [Ancylomarina salipaludis]|uniref:Arc family DNA-binding protein n=1 Tax=Ancylomarina salipaludis TaxID=2501299 RepID=A0A4Q1JKM5_9BACT|nr:Arc family DNA-binding protein [Ancylomarina salipaludis]RXQ93907.1 Arc family DNA-binding protein [Ancylomarina salipaludis]
MTKKKSFVLRLNPEIYKKLEKWASDEFRSVNGQIEWIIDKSLKDSGRKKKESSVSEDVDKEGDV